MTDTRQRRIAALQQAARRKSEAKTKAAESAIRNLVKRDEPVTFQSVQREAGVSHAFLYAHPALRARIEHLRQRNRPAIPAPADSATSDNIVLALTAEVARLRKRLRDQEKELREALAQAHGENLELRRELARRGVPAPSPTTRIADPC